MTGAAKLIRGALAAVVAVGSAALAHAVAGHHGPHWIVLVLALAVSVPVCVQLSGIRLSRRRLTAAVATSQAFLHGLFAMMPASSAGSVDLVGDPHLHHQQHLVLDVGINAAAQAGDPHSGATMLATHTAAALLSYGLLRRGETLLYAIADQLSLAPVFILLTGAPSVIAGQDGLRIPVTTAPDSTADAWAGADARTLRGPPVLVN